jgi:NAD(P)H-hydrate repair Nnr-like enzyme with NAD(P)H-hydrate epimerase domain
MKKIAIDSHPILSNEETRTLETRLFGGDEELEWGAMQRAGRAVAEAVLRDFGEIGGFPPGGRILVLAGKGNNAGDALIAARVILERHSAARAEVVFPFGERAFRPLAWRAWRELVQLGGKAEGRVNAVTSASVKGSRDLSIDGVFGFQFRPP